MFDDMNDEEIDLSEVRSKSETEEEEEEEEEQEVRRRRPTVGKVFLKITLLY